MPKHLPTAQTKRTASELGPNAAANSDLLDMIQHLPPPDTLRHATRRAVKLRYIPPRQQMSVLLAPSGGGHGLVVSFSTSEVLYYIIVRVVDSTVGGMRCDWGHLMLQVGGLRGGVVPFSRRSVDLGLDFNSSFCNNINIIH